MSTFSASNGTTTYYYASGIINGCENFGEIVADNIVAVPIHGGIMGRLRVVNPTAINCNNHVVPVGTNAQELLGVKASGNLTIINFTDAAHQTPETPENPDVTTSGSETTTKPTDDVPTTTPSADTTTVPSGNDTTTVPSDNGTTTAEPADNTTAKPDDTTAKPDDTTAKPDDTTVKTDEPKKKGCGGFAVAAQLIAILGAAITVIAVKKK